MARALAEPGPGGDVRLRSELERDGLLRAYFAILSACLALTALAWTSYKHVDTLVTGEDYACWPLWPGCEAVRPMLSPGLVRAAVIVVVVSGAGGAAAFLVRRLAFALGAFAASLALAVAIYALDYRLRLNQTYMLGWVVAVALLAPRRGPTLQVLVALFYFWAGALKLDREWLSGAALYAEPLLVPTALVPAACVYVVVLEMVLVWGLFSSRAWVRWTVYAQLLLFHAVSWSIVGWYYPLLMVGLTAVYPLTWLLAPEQRSTAAKLAGDRPARAGIVAVSVVFSALQIAPRLFPGDTAVTGEGRLFALHMFDARVTCDGGAEVRTSRGQHALVPLINDHLETRMRCDPIVLSEQIRRLCQNLAGRPDSPTVDVRVDARRATDGEMRPLLHASDACHADLSYSLWHHNAWIGAP